MFHLSDYENPHATYAQRAAAAVEEWEGLGAPIHVGLSDPQVRSAVGDAALTETTRGQLRAWASGPKRDEDQAKVVLGYVLAHIEHEWSRRASAERAAGMARRRAARQARRELVAAELREMRDALGLTETEADALLGLRPGTFKNMAAPDGTYSVDRVERLAAALRAQVKAGAAK